MRLAEVERGDRLSSRILFRLISVLSRTRFPDAARVAFYHRDFVGPELNAWTHHVMRGPSEWSVAERELMAAMVARWNSSPFCVGAHRAVAETGMDAGIVDAALSDYHSAPISRRLTATLTFLEKLTLAPERLDAADALRAIEAGTSTSQLRDASAVAAVFNIVTRYANALDFEIPSPSQFARGSRVLLRRGYR